MLIGDNRPLAYSFDRRVVVSVPCVSAANGEEADAAPAGLPIVPSFNVHAIRANGLKRYDCAPDVRANASELPYLVNVGVGERACVRPGNL